MTELDGTEQRWLYVDPQQNVQGPFSSKEMSEWFNAGYFGPSLPVRAMNQLYFVSLHQLFGHSDRGMLQSEIIYINISALHIQIHTDHQK